MNTSRNGFIAFLLLILIAVLFIGGGAYIFTKQSNQSVPENSIEQSVTTMQTPTISLVSPSDGIITWGYDSGTPITITGNNFNYLYPSNCQTTECLQQPHIFVNINYNDGHSEIACTIPDTIGSCTTNSDGTKITGSIPFDVGIDKSGSVPPGRYSLSVSVDGKGTSNTFPITIVPPSR